MGSATGGGMGILRYKVRAWRKAAEMTQADLALATGKTVQTISALECGRPTRQSTLDAVARVCLRTEWHSGDLLRGSWTGL
ncbi:helix-turn-helix domain-containing protein [Agrobacterium vitis]|uniref:Helix-turn-helix domain-containing protein n=1 Tax=Agrobacterium vitis TaxID=373 RepID=A0A6L6VH05_AGRVI|nr:helix-turn-helix domain-containing protein [Agrobacterium vitis]